MAFGSGIQDSGALSGVLFGPEGTPVQVVAQDGSHPGSELFSIGALAISGVR